VETERMQEEAVFGAGSMTVKCIDTSLRPTARAAAAPREIDPPPAHGIRRQLRSGIGTSFIDTLVPLRRKIQGRPLGTLKAGAC